ncbi:bifunctional riboflavin kinase/FAD synthetase [bacterium]|nr:bifunctional riboflavin kinase/FAD synthetase [bacterium]
MKVYRNLGSLKRNLNNVLTVGTFDGVHRGHQFILDELKTRATALGAQTTVVTFDPHPQLVLNSTDRPPLKVLTTTEEKVDLLTSLGIDQIVVIEFTKDFASTNSSDFVRDQLYGKIGFCEMVIGHDHAFGKDRDGNIQTLKTMADEIGFKVESLPAFEIDGMIISSTRMRKLITSGAIKDANSCLGRRYAYSGVVVEGDKRGQTLGFPTANIAPSSPHKLLPGDGVYAVYVDYESAVFKGMMNIGVRPTFDSLQHTAEVHIFDFSDTIYGKTLGIEFVEKIRDEFKFSSSDEFIIRLQKDKEFSLEIL